MLLNPVYTRAPTSLDGVVKRLNAQVDAETGYEFEVRRGHVLTDCLRVVQRKDFSPKKMITVGQ